MTAPPTPSQPSHRPPNARQYASPGLIRFVADAVLLIGLIMAIGGVGYDINAMTQTRGYVQVGVQARSLEGLRIPLTTDQGSREFALNQRNEEAEWETIRLNVPGASAGWLDVPPDRLILRSWGATMLEQATSRGAFAVIGLCVGYGALLLRGLLLSIAEGQPFRTGNARRIATIGGLVVVGSLAADVFPVVAGGLVLSRLGLTEASSPIFSQLSFSLWPLLAVSILLALAEAFRRGGQLARDVDGLV